MIARMGLTEARRGTRRKAMLEHLRRRVTLYRLVIPVRPEGYGGVGHVMPRAARNAVAQGSRTAS